LHPAWRKAIRAGYYYHAFKALQERQHRDAAAAKGTFDRLLHQAALRMDHDAP